MKTVITLSLLPSSPGMPFVLGPDLGDGFQIASELGFDAVEIFPPTLESIDSTRIAQLCVQHSLQVSTIGTGGGAIAQGLTLTDSDANVRHKARDYIRGIIEVAGDMGASAIIGSMQGKSDGRVKSEVLTLLADAMSELGEYANRWQQPLFYEPLNRYETDLVNRLDDAVEMLKRGNVANTKVLADLFHMNIEEPDLVASITRNADHIGHVHFVDSNRRTAGAGHLDLRAVIQALQIAGYDGCLAVEAFPLPDQLTAAKNAAAAFDALLPSRHSQEKRV